MDIKNISEANIMTDMTLNDAIREFAHSLSASDQFKNYDRGKTRYQQDGPAQKAFQEYQMLAQSLQTKQMFNTLSESEKSDLERLWVAFLSHEPVSDLMQSQQELQALCRVCAQLISDQIGLDYATSCGASCCG
jgi:cell fate (sporulation/competence/biofilm development) regulator YlbF (YheA/YmcA/DUF963 family)